MEKKDINNCMLFKLKNEYLCVLFQNLNAFTFDDFIFYNKLCIDSGGGGGVVKVNRYKDNLLHVEYDSFDIIAIKQFPSMNEVLYHVLNNKEPEEWDWIREEKKEVKSVKLPIYIKKKMQIRSRLKKMFDKV